MVERVQDAPSAKIRIKHGREHDNQGRFQTKSRQRPSIVADKQDCNDSDDPSDRTQQQHDLAKAFHGQPWG